MSTTTTNTLFQRVEASLESIRPYLAVDGGDIRLIEITNENVVRIKLLGNCSDCHMSEMTMKAGVEETIFKSVPEITKVEAV